MPLEPGGTVTFEANESKRPKKADHSSGDSPSPTNGPLRTAATSADSVVQTSSIQLLRSRRLRRPDASRSWDSCDAGTV